MRYIAELTNGTYDDARDYHLIVETDDIETLTTQINQRAKEYAGLMSEYLVNLYRVKKDNEFLKVSQDKKDAAEDIEYFELPNGQGVIAVSDIVYIASYKKHFYHVNEIKFVPLEEWVETSLKEQVEFIQTVKEIKEERIERRKTLVNR